MEIRKEEGYSTDSKFNYECQVEYDFYTLNSICIQNEHLFAYENTGLVIYKIEENYYFSFIGRYDIRSTKSVCATEDIIYLVTEKNMITIDSSNLAEPSKLDKHTQEDQISLIYMKINK